MELDFQAEVPTYFQTPTHEISLLASLNTLNYFITTKLKNNLL